MRIKLFLSLMILATPLLAQKVYIDYDKTVDFSDYKTFAWARTEAVSLQDTSPLMDSRIKNAIEYQLASRGLREDMENPDLYVTYHGEEQDEMRVDTSNFGYGYGPGWGWDPYWDTGFGTSTTTVTTYTKGTLIIDIYDAENKQAIWRGSATATIPERPEKAAKQIDKAVEKLAKRWEKMYGPVVR